jgi:hypothetical protein
MRRGQSSGAPIQRTAEPIPAEGPGTELKAIFASLGITQSLGCGCEALAKQMNVWGVARSRANRCRIVKQIEDTAKKRGWGETLLAAGAAVWSGLAWQINPLDRFGSLVDLALHRAEERGSAKA